MRITITVDDTRSHEALELADPDLDKADLICEAVLACIRVQAGKRLAALGGQALDMQEAPRRRGTLEPE